MLKSNQIHMRRNSQFVSVLLLMLALLLLTPIAEINSQSLSSSDLSRVRSEQVTEAQLRQFVQRANNEGVTIDHAIQMAVSRGLPQAEAIELRERIALLQSGGSNELQTRDLSGNGRQIHADSVQIADRDGERTQRRPLTPRDSLLQARKLRTFGSNLFQTETLTFAPSMNIPTPRNYQVGPGDEIIISIWGDATDQFILEVSPEGTISLNNLGPVFINGLTMDEAKNRIIQSLARMYSGLRPQDGRPSTFAEVSLGRVRSITVTIAGEVQNPGTYTVSSLATLFNALYISGGPNNIGSYRKIRLIRQNETVATFDLYDFLLNGAQTANVRLHDQDVVFVDAFASQSEISGETRRNGIFELLGGETVGDLVRYAGGFTNKAFAQRVRIHRFTDRERRMVTVPSDLFDDFVIMDGDEVFIDEILDRYENRVMIEGAVWREGEYELKPGMTVSDLITIADGLRPDAFRSRGLINRIRDDLTFEQISFDVNAVVNDPSGNDIPLFREDVVLIRGVRDLMDSTKVEIAGAVRDAGVFLYYDNMTLEDLILKANGLSEAASTSRIEISRRILENKDFYEPGAKLVENFIFSVDKDLGIKDDDKSFRLSPYDFIYVYRRPDYSLQQLVTIEGEVMYPGTYTISNRNETIADLVRRAGGLTSEAYIPGARLNRLEGILDRANIRYDFIDTSEEIAEDRDFTVRIGIDLQTALNNSNSRENLLLRQGDVLRIPKRTETVRISGAVMQQVEVRYRDRLGLNYYLNRAGGYNLRAYRSRAYVIYANGDVDRKRNFLWIPYHTPKIEPGAEIVIPFKPEERRGMSTAEFISMTSVVVSMSTTLLLAIDRYRR